MKITYIFLAFIAILGYNAFLAKRDTQLMKAHDACIQYKHHPDCPKSWKTNYESSRPQ
jgi:hypothetical protein